MGEGTEIAGVVSGFETGTAQGGEFFRHIQLQKQIAFVITHKDIVPGSISLDEPGFQDQCFIVTADDFKVPFGDTVDE